MEPGTPADHLDPAEAINKIKSGELYQGILMVYRNMRDKAWLRV